MVKRQTGFICVTFLLKSILCMWYKVKYGSGINKVKYVMWYNVAWPKKKFLCSRRQNHTQRIKWAYIRNTALFFVLFSEPKYFWPLFALVLFYKVWNEIAAFLQLPFANSFWRVQEISLFLWHPESGSQTWARHLEWGRSSNNRNTL